MPKKTRRSVIASRLKAYTSYINNFASSWAAAWKTLTGTWTSTSNVATTATAASSYPMAVVPMASPSVTVQLQSTSQGSGATLWATDSGNWWGVVTGQDAGTSCNCDSCAASNCASNCSGCNAWTCNSYVNSNCVWSFNGTCTGYNVNNCNAYNTSTCSGYTCNSWACTGGYNTCTGYNTSNCSRWNSTKNCAAYNGSNCKGYTCSYYGCNSGGYSCSSWNASNCSGTWNGTSCKGYNAACAIWSLAYCAAASCQPGASYNYCCSYYNYSYACNCQTCYPPFVRLLQSVGGTVTEITKWTLSAVANSLKVITTGSSGNVTVKAYSDSTLATQIGSDLTYVGNGARIETQFGIMVAPSTYSQGGTVGQVNIQTN